MFKHRRQSNTEPLMHSAAEFERGGGERPPIARFPVVQAAPKSIIEEITGAAILSLDPRKQPLLRGYGNM